MGFKSDFVWGAATAAYQLEGAYLEDGKGLNIWDTFSHVNGKVYDNHNGDVACDHYHHLEEDLDIMKQMGLRSYRFSVSWSRIMPKGTGEVNQKGIDFYNRLIDGLIARGIEPCMTLYHWDLPYALHLKGGWLNDDSSDWFEKYTRVIMQYFGDRVSKYITFNEPQVFVGCGYFNGEHAPGYRLSKGELLRIGHNVLKAHGKAVKALHEDPKNLVGITVASCPSIPENESKPEDIEAARKKYFESNYDGFAFSDAYWIDAAVLGKYPDWVYAYEADDKPEITDADMELINQPIEFIGMNIYRGRYVNTECDELPLFMGNPRTAIGWPITPRALYWGPRFYYERYQKPIIITESGMSAHDVISLDGKVHDPNRTDYLNRYLLELRRAANDGVAIDGYYVWSFIDNFEWACGYSERFGIVFCDYETEKRIRKDSSYWYEEVIRANGDNL